MATSQTDSGDPGEDGTGHAAWNLGSEPVAPERRVPERRPDAWGDFLRRMLVTVGLAGAAVVPAPAEEPPAEIASPAPDAGGVPSIQG